MSPAALPVAVLCAGGHGRTLRGILESQGRTVWLYDDASALPLSMAERLTPGTADMVVGLGLVDGRTEARAAMTERFHQLGFKFASVVAESAAVMGDLGAGAQVLPGAVIGVGASVHGGAIIGSGAVVEHDCVVGDWAFIGPGVVLCGSVRLGMGAVIGAGAVVLPGVVVGPDAVVGAGAVVLGDVTAGSTVVGAPARARVARAESRPVGAYAAGSARAAAETERIKAAYPFRQVSTEGVRIQSPDGTLGPLQPHAARDAGIDTFPCDQECPE